MTLESLLLVPKVGRGGALNFIRAVSGTDCSSAGGVGGRESSYTGAGALLLDADLAVELPITTDLQDRAETQS